jgi:hypothetical protein
VSRPRGLKAVNPGRRLNSPNGRAIVQTQTPRRTCQGDQGPCQRVDKRHGRKAESSGLQLSSPHPPVRRLFGTLGRRSIRPMSAASSGRQADDHALSERECNLLENLEVRTVAGVFDLGDHLLAEPCSPRELRLSQTCIVTCPAQLKLDWKPCRRIHPDHSFTWMRTCSRSRRDCTSREARGEPYLQCPDRLPLDAGSIARRCDASPAIREAGNHRSPGLRQNGRIAQHVPAPRTSVGREGACAQTT